MLEGKVWQVLHQQAQIRVHRQRIRHLLHSNDFKNTFATSKLNNNILNFQLVRLALNYTQPISSQLMTPVQRVTRYNLLLSEAEKNFLKAGDTEKHAIVSEAFQDAREICEYANDMMVAGRMSGFPVRLAL